MTFSRPWREIIADVFYVYKCPIGVFNKTAKKCHRLPEWFTVFRNVLGAFWSYVRFGSTARLPSDCRYVPFYSMHWINQVLNFHILLKEDFLIKTTTTRLHQKQLQWPVWPNCEGVGLWCSSYMYHTQFPNAPTLIYTWAV